MNNRNFIRGFTLVEILVVLAIISLLSAIIFASFQDAREQATNKSVKSELKETQLAIEFYKAQNGSYPPAQQDPTAPLGCVVPSGGVDIADSDVCGNFFLIISGLVPEYIESFPDDNDSKNPNCHYLYMVESVNHSWYKLIAENCYSGATAASEGVHSDDSMARCSSICSSTGACDPTDSDFYQSYAIYSQGGECENP